MTNNQQTTKEYDPIKLKNLIDILTSCYEKHADAPECQEEIRVEFWIGEKELELASIGQFEIIPTVTITMKEPSDD